MVRGAAADVAAAVVVDGVFSICVLLVCRLLAVAVLAMAAVESRPVDTGGFRVVCDWLVEMVRLDACGAAAAGLAIDLLAVVEVVAAGVLAEGAVGAFENVYTELETMVAVEAVAGVEPA